MAYYQWYNPQSGNQRDDIQISLKVYSGKVDVYVNNYDQFDEANIVDRLPSSIRKSFYS
jgi:hypothetical protein